MRLYFKWNIVTLFSAMTGQRCCASSGFMFPLSNTTWYRMLWPSSRSSSMNFFREGELFGVITTEFWGFSLLVNPSVIFCTIIITTSLASTQYYCQRTGTHRRHCRRTDRILYPRVACEWTLQYWIGRRTRGYLIIIGDCHRQQSWCVH